MILVIDSGNSRMQRGLHGPRGSLGDGVFHGGVILPGLRLMLQSLADRTSALKVAAGEFRDFPTNTADALYSGVMQAICGAIEQMRAKLGQGEVEVKCYIAGGAATEI